jgi:site-specific recombinase XerD
MPPLPDDARHASKLSFLSPHCRDQLLRYLRALSARKYAPGTVEAVVTVIKRFLRDLPQPRRDALADDLAKTLPRDITEFVRIAQGAGPAPSTINLSLSVLSEFFDFLRDEGLMQAQPVIARRHRLLAPATLPKPMPEPELVRFFKAVDSQRDRLLFLLMLRCGLRVSEVSRLKVSDIDWEQKALLIEQGKGRKDLWVYLSADALASLHECLRKRPLTAPGDSFFWNQKQQRCPLTVKAIQKKMERYAKAAGIKASCHSLRHTFASNLLEEGAEVVSIRELLGHSSVASSERYARLSNRRVKQEYLQTIRKVIAKTRV